MRHQPEQLSYDSQPAKAGRYISGSNHTVLQQADLLVNDVNGVGIGVEGQGNSLTILPGTRIYADGLNGRGVLFASGNRHRFVQSGDVQALGENGIAASFSADSNDSQEPDSDRLESEEPSLTDKQSNTLMELVDITGRLAGKRAAIYIAPEAWVKRINFMAGAQLAGDIVSEYAEQDSDGSPRLTHITFGMKADEYGQATDWIDETFRFTYQDDIDGAESLAIWLKGGITSLNGAMDIFSLEVAPGAMLTGEGEYTLNPQGAFINHGTILPADGLGHMTINGDFQQGAQGTLLVGVTAAGDHGALEIEGNAMIDGRLLLIPQRGWYNDDWSLDSDELLQADSQQGDFSAIGTVAVSPTLTLVTTPVENQHYQLSFTRQKDAYSRYASSANGREVGQALYRLAQRSNNNIQPFFTALDFSAADGHEIGTTLEQLSPSSYGAMIAGALARERQITHMLVARNGVSPNQPTEKEEWHGFVMPFGGGESQTQQLGRLGYRSNHYGIIAGAEKLSRHYPALLVGIHGALSKRSVSSGIGDSARGEGDAVELGLHARFAADPASGPYLFGVGRIGIERNHMARSITLPGYAVQHQAGWNSVTNAVSLGGGYYWTLSDNFSIGPQFSLGYDHITNLGAQESGSDASRLTLSASHADSWRSSLGLSAKSNLLNNTDVEIQLLWNRELFRQDFVQRAYFSDAPDIPFSSHDTLSASDPLEMRMGLSYRLTPTVSMGAVLSTEMASAGYHAMAGNLSFSWRF
ncbi:TPA: autotransporter outer membrane beta-barrel domain-containing protein [Serratia fonticola]|uniref:autotransporter outer membrane beta-barrel domain-containing protein n=1 Tax=Serratia fonticola TaxID=47917 RepID=UPI0021BD5159|nr:autotransporter outer membrane beta-barrel domain-containing protein [Serratia fonticola]